MQLLQFVVTLLLAAWYRSARITDLREDMGTRFGAVERRLEKLEGRVEGLQERTWR